MIRRGIQSLIRATPLRPVSDTQASRRGFMSKAEYEQQVPEHVRRALESDPPEPQQVSVGECHFQASTARARVQSRLHASGQADLRGTTETNSSRWTKAHAEGVVAGRPATVRGHNATTDVSEWRNGSTGHAVTVLSPTTDGRGFVVFDPDTTHHPETAPPVSGAPREPRHDLRVMTQAELERVGQVMEDLGQGEFSSLPVVEQRNPTLLGGLQAQLYSMLGADPDKSGK